MDAKVAYAVMALNSAAQAVADVWPLLGVALDGCVSAWLENPERAGGLELRDNNLPLVEAQTLLPAWVEGRLFGPQGELHWEHLAGESWHLVVLTERDAALPAGYQEPLNLTRDGADEPIMLWGERQGDRWYEERIPRLNYPRQWTQRYAQLIIRHYIAHRTADRPYDSHVVRYVSFATTDRLG